MGILKSTKPSFCKAYYKLIYQISIFLLFMALSCWRVISKSSKTSLTLMDTTVDED